MLLGGRAETSSPPPDSREKAGVPGEFSLTNYFLFIGKKSCSGDELLTKRKRRLLGGFASGRPAGSALLPPQPLSPSPSVVSSIPVPLAPSASDSFPFPFRFLSEESPGQRKVTLPARGSTESGPEPQLPGGLSFVGTIFPPAQMDCSGRGRRGVLGEATPGPLQPSHEPPEASVTACLLLRSPDPASQASPGQRSSLSPESRATC